MRYNEIKGGAYMIKLVKNLAVANCVTHSGTFHADEVFATCFLSKVLDEVRLIRLNDVKDVEGKLIYDIGWKEFDHHQEDARVRENKIKYSSFGLLFEQFGRDYLKKLGIQDIDYAYSLFLKEFVYQIDAIDNGELPNILVDYEVTTLSHVIELFNPTWKEHGDTDEYFDRVLNIAMPIYERMESKILAKVSARDKVNQKIEESKSHILELDEHMPYVDFILEHPKGKDILFVIFPSNRGGYSIRTVPKQRNSFESRQDLLKEWGGKTEEELISLTGIKTFYFCHPKLFCASTRTLEDARKVALMALKKG